MLLPLMRHPTPRWFVLIACCVPLAACGSGGGKPVAQTTASGGSKPASTGTTTVTTTTTMTTTPPTPPRHLAGFQSPSRNIGCYMSVQPSAYARCDIRSRSWSPPPRPPRCPLDWGQGVELTGAHAGQIVCAGDTTLDPSAPVLAYGQSSRAGPVLCQSSETGVTCTNTATGHGFFLARASYRLF